MRPVFRISGAAMFFLLLCGNLIFAQDPFVALDPFNAEEKNSNGVGWADYDGDGYLDIYVTNGSDFSGQNNLLYRNNSGNDTFQKITTGEIVTDQDVSGSCSWGDFDNDGDPDMYVTALQKNFFGQGKNNSLQENQGDGTFIKNTTCGPPVSDAINSAAAGWGDYNGDSWLDIFVSNGYSNPIASSLYSNDGDKTFTSITGIDLVHNDYATALVGFAWADYDNDLDLDLYTASGNTNNNILWRNDGGNTFTNVVTFQVARSQAGSWGDYDNDGDLDLYIANYGPSETEQEANFLYRNDGGDTFTKMTPAQVGDIVNDELISKGSAWGDIDNDGDLDMFVATPGAPDEVYKNCLYINDGSGYFTKATSVVQDAAWGFGTAMADFNNDGFLDIFLCRTYNNILYKNVEPQNGNTNRWLIVEVEGVASNKSAIGTKVRAKATINSQVVWQMREISGQTGYGSQNSMRVHFGLGSSAGLAKAAATIVTELRIDFPSGNVVTKTNVATNQILTVSESEAPIAVKLASFDARMSNSGSVVLQWQTAGEMNTAGFYIQRSTSATGGFHRIHPNIITSKGSPSIGSTYSYTDETIPEIGNYYYRLEELTLSGESVMMEPIQVSVTSAVGSEAKPQGYHLAQNYPNPFNPRTTIDYHLPIKTKVQLAIYDLRGVLVRTLVNETQHFGAHTVQWDGTNQNGDAIGSGVYIFKLTNDDFALTRKMVLAR